MRANLLCLLAFLALSLAPPHVGASDWPQFRGADGEGVVADAKLPLTWSESEGIVWKTPLAGRGWSSPVVADGKIWVTTAEETPLTPDEQAAMQKKLAALSPGDPMEAAASIALSAIEIDAATGEVLRTVKLFDVKSPAPIHGHNSFASPTPVLAAGKCFCHFGTYGTACVDTATGEVRWRKKLEINHIVGPGSSPIVVDDLLIIPCDGSDKQFIAALDVATGDTRWKVDRPPIREANPDQKKASCTPLLVEAAGRKMVVIPGAQWFIAYDPQTGSEIWRIDHGNGFSNVPRPVFDGERVYLCTGFGRGTLWAVSPDGTGDVTTSHAVWKVSQQVPTMPSPVVTGGLVTMISDGGVATCMDAKTGKVQWRERIGGKFSASPMAGAGRIYFLSQEGRTTVIAAGPKFEVLARNELDGQHMASPAVIDGDLLLRTDSHLYRISSSVAQAKDGNVGN